MNVKVIFLAGACGAAFLSPVQAEAQTRTRGGFEIGAEVFDYNYRERFEGQAVARDDGRFGGLTASYVETLGGRTFLRARLSTDFGSVDYSSDDGRIDDVSQSIGQLELQLGYDFALSPNLTLSPFIGLGSRVLDDESGGRETGGGLAGYDREISYAFVPVGAAVTGQIGGSKTLTFSAQYNWVVGGDAKSKFSSIDPEFPNLKMDIRGGHGLEASVIVGLPVGRRQIRFGPFVRHWNIDRSKSLTFQEDGEEIELFEPANKTTEWGVRLSFAF